MKKIRLGVNIDHVATVRNARGEIYPSPLRAALLAQKSGADSITIHLREDRRHIIDNDLIEIKEKLIKTGKLQYIYRDFPLDMPAMLAAMVTNCYEGEQFHTTLNSLFRNQKNWVTASSNKEELLNAFHKILKQHGISLEKIKICTAENEDNKKKWDSILTSRLEGQKLGINSTPSFILNGKKLEGSVDIKVLLKHIY